MFHWIVMNVINMVLKIAIVANLVLPEPSLPKIDLATANP